MGAVGFIEPYDNFLEKKFGKRAVYEGMVDRIKFLTELTFAIRFDAQPE